MQETRQSTRQDHHEGHNGGGHRGRPNVMGLLMAGGMAVLVAALLIPSVGLLLGIGAGFLAGAFMFAMHGGGMGRHGSGTGGHRGHGC